MVLQDGSYHVVDSSELAFRIATISAFREIYTQTKPIILEPIMTVEVVAPSEFQSAVIGSLNQRRGTILDSEVRDEEFVCTAEVPLNDMFGYSSQLRGVTQGKGEFSMEYRVWHSPFQKARSSLSHSRRTYLFFQMSKKICQRPTGRRSLRQRSKSFRRHSIILIPILLHRLIVILQSNTRHPRS